MNRYFISIFISIFVGGFVGLLVSIALADVSFHFAQPEVETISHWEVSSDGETWIVVENIIEQEDGTFRATAQLLDERVIHIRAVTHGGIKSTISTASDVLPRACRFDYDGDGKVRGYDVGQAHRDMMNLSWIFKEVCHY